MDCRVLKYDKQDAKRQAWFLRVKILRSCFAKHL